MIIDNIKLEEVALRIRDHNRIHSKEPGAVIITECLNFAAEIIEKLDRGEIQPVVETENMATVSDEFICKKCGIYLKDYIKVVMDEDNDGYIDEQHYDYEPKFCPECGAEVKDGDTENDN